MKRLILTGWTGTSLTGSGLADLVIGFSFRFVWGPLPSPSELAAYLGARSDKPGRGYHWSDFVGRWPKAERARRDLALAEFCERYDVVELWFDADPNDQIQLCWLLDHLGSHPRLSPRLKLRVVDFDLIAAYEKEFRRRLEWVPAFDITDHEVEAGRAAWGAYQATTPEASFDLLGTDLSGLPLLRPALIDLLEELPCGRTGLGATEMRMLELIGRGYAGTNALFHFHELRRRRVFREFEHGALLEGLAHGPRPAVAGLDDALRSLSYENYRDRHQAYLRSRVSLTEFGRSILAYKEDFSRYNPIDRWWGGTRLTNDRLWQWDRVLVAP
jgi:hypothetical protein